MKKHIARFEVEVEVRVADDSDAVTRVTENHPSPSIANPDARWKDQYYDLDGELQVVAHIAGIPLNSIWGDDLSRYDGWADLAKGECEMVITDVYPLDVELDGSGAARVPH